MTSPQDQLDANFKTIDRYTRIITFNVVLIGGLQALLIVLLIIKAYIK